MIKIVNKKAQNLSMKVIVIAVLVVLAGATIACIVNEIYKFDPSKHVCEELECKMYQSGHGIIPDSCVSYSDKCTSWRPKTFCDLCLDSWTDECEAKCKCLGTENMTTTQKVWVWKCNHSDGIKSTTPCYPNGTCPAIQAKYGMNSCKPDRREMSIQEAKCTQAVPKTECEKGNPNYILVNETWNPCENDKPEDAVPLILCDDHIIEVCRKKTIEDYTCDELKEHIFIEDYYCPSTNKWTSDDDFECPFREHWIYQSSLKKIYVSKGCEI